MIDNQTTELAVTIEALTSLASAITWTVPNSMPAVESYLKDAWAAIDKLKGVAMGELLPCAICEGEINGDTSDGYHTFNELYHHRAVLFSVIVRDHRELAWKARKHHDGTMYEGMFIVGIETPKGQATYHYYIDPYWEMFDCEEREFAPEWDGHTPDDAIARIAVLNTRAEREEEVDDPGYSKE